MDRGISCGEINKGTVCGGLVELLIVANGCYQCIYGVVGLKPLLGAELVWGEGFMSGRELRESLVKNAFEQFCCHTR